jgi:peptidylprolyl isomerase
VDPDPGVKGEALEEGDGSCVTISYVGTLDNGRILLSSDEQGPLTFTIGSGQLFPALERAVIGMRRGEAKDVVLAPEEVYGPRLTENIIQVDRQAFPAGKEINAGQKLRIDFSGGASRVMLVVDVNDSAVTLDGNHPLAGCELTFALRLDLVE